MSAPVIPSSDSGSEMSFARSAQIIAEAQQFVPGGVNSNFRMGIPPTPLVFERADGPYLTDVDGNRFVDYYLGMGPMLLGHRPQVVIEAVQEQLGRSLLVGGQTPIEYDAARLLVDLVPSAESVRFCSSGSEADQAALRLARAVTGRTTILKFEGHYHGWFDNVLWSVALEPPAGGDRREPIPVGGSAGQMPPSGIEVLPWNDAELVKKRLARGDVAAVLMEPIMFNSMGIAPVPGYLEAVREACSSTGTVLIFDEVITGFRVSAGGAQAALGVVPDLTVLGKALANGFPVAALVGRRELMDLFATGSVLHGGTYNTQAVSMAATKATLESIASGSPYGPISAAGTALMEGLRDEFDRAGIEAVVMGYPAVFHVRLGALGAKDYREGLQADRARYAEFALALLRHGIRVLPRGTWFVSSTHGQDAVEETLRGVRKVLSSRAL